MSSNSQMLEATSSTQTPAMKRGNELDPNAQNGGSKRRRRDVVRPGIPTETLPSSFVVPDRPSPPFRDDDADGHYTYQLGDNLSSRYKILSKMGEGTFGRVLECWDRKHKDYVAIKIVRNIDKYRHAAMIELEVLNTLEINDPDGIKHCVALREWFNYRGHVCMVFEKLGPSLFDLLRRNRYSPFPITLVQEISRQLIESVAYMHDLSLIHTDLKPENVLFVELMDEQATRRSVSVSSRSCSSSMASYYMPSSSEIKVIDFGSATFEEQYHSTIVSTRHYRAPEVILGMGWSFPADMWSIGCILVELITGEALFQTHDNLEHLAMMERVLGPIPASMAQSSSKAAAKYFRKSRLNWPEGATSRKSVKAVLRLHSTLKCIIQKQGDASVLPYIDPLCDLLLQLLRYEPDKRMTAEQALMHPFLSLPLCPSEEAVALLVAVGSTGVPLSMQTSSMPTNTVLTAVETDC